MKSLIKLFLLFLVVIIVSLYFCGGWFLEKAGSYILDTPVNISKVKFMPHKFAFKLYGINLPRKHILFSSGSVFLLPPKLEFYGLIFKNKILLNEKSFSSEIFWRNNWQVGIFFKGVDLSKLVSGFKRGIARGSIDGIYSGGTFSFFGLVHLNKVVYSESGGIFLGMTSEEFQELIDIHKGNLEIDFTYKGPIDKVNELYRYNPGKKAIGLARDYIIQKLSE